MDSESENRAAVSSMIHLRSRSSAPMSPTEERPISIGEWAQTASLLPSKNEYISCAVKLACMLTTHLRKVASIAEVEPRHITAENVVIFIDYPLEQPPPIISCNFVNAVKLQLDVNCSLRLATGASVDSRPYLAALGKILLTIFTKGVSISSDLEDISDESSNTYSDHNNENTILPAEKRKAVPPTRGSASSSMANKILVDHEMPLSICRLVCDLLNSKNSQHTSSALTSLEEAEFDLVQMNEFPESFLFDRISPQKALDDTGLFAGANGQYLFGREKEISILMDAQKSISSFVRQEVASQSYGNSAHPCEKKNGTRDISNHVPVDVENSTIHSVSTQGSKSQGSNFLCESIFLSGLAGTGKSSLLHSVIEKCDKEQWFVLSCKFDRRTAPHSILAKAFDLFFGKHLESDSSARKKGSFNEVCRFIFSGIDDEGLCQLGEICPNFSTFFPLVAATSTKRNREPSMNAIGSASNRRLYLFRLLVKSICSAGVPVLLALDDLQWSSPMVLDIVRGFVESDNYFGDAPGMPAACQQGILVLGAFRSNEVKENDSLMKATHAMELSQTTNFSNISIEALAERDVHNLVSKKLCLPLRYSKELSRVVYAKTANGNSFFVIQWLKSIIQNKLLEFSIKNRCWIWDIDLIEMEMISDGAAHLLATTFDSLPPPLIKTVKIMACMGAQVERNTVELMNKEEQVLSFDMVTELEHGVKAGLLERAGPVFQFTHDILHQTIYELIPSKNRSLLHKTIGESLLRSGADIPTIYLLAVDQYNIYCKDGNPSQEERSQLAQNNATAAKLELVASSYEQARSYIDMGIQLLENQHWGNQYSLSLDLYEMSAHNYYGNGDIEATSSCIDEILLHASKFEDTLEASALLAKLLAASTRYDEALKNCRAIAANLGEEFPEQITLQLVLDELHTVESTLSGLSTEQIKSLPKMNNATKLSAMRFMNLMSSYSFHASPLLLPLLGCRMVRMTMEFGFSDNSLVGFVLASYGLFLITENVHLGYRVGKMCEPLIDASPNKNMLRSRLCLELDCSLKMIVEPFQSVLYCLPDRYNSAKLVGDLENALMCRTSYCIGNLYSGLKLSSLIKHFTMLIRESTKCQQMHYVHSATPFLSACLKLSGKDSEEVTVKSNDELENIAKETNNPQLIWQCFIGKISAHFWMGDYSEVMALSEAHHNAKHVRILNIMRVFYEGISSLNLARGSGESTEIAKWRAVAQQSLEYMSKLTSYSEWNFRNKLLLMQAELHFLEGNNESAEEAYAGSIENAHAHKFIHEEALAYELAGIFHIENQMFNKGFSQLQIAVEKYKKWGALEKSNRLQLVVDTLAFQELSIQLGDSF